MNNYKESKKKIDAIRDKYGCKGEVIFRTAIQMIVEWGQNNFNDEEFYEDNITEINSRHDKAEAENKILFMSREFEKALIECARALAQIQPYDLLTYIQREVWLGGREIGEPDYQRAMQIIRDCLCYTADCYGSYRLDQEEALGKFRNIGLSDEEIEYFGWGELLDEEFEEEDE